MNCFIEWFASHLLFEARPADMLVNLSTGVIADEAINCDNAWAVGTDSQKDMIGKTFT